MCCLATVLVAREGRFNMLLMAGLTRGTVNTKHFYRRDNLVTTPTSSQCTNRAWADGRDGGVGVVKVIAGVDGHMGQAAFSENLISRRFRPVVHSCT